MANKNYILTQEAIDKSFIYARSGENYYIYFFSEGRRIELSTRTKITRDAKNKHEKWKTEQRERIQQLERGEIEKAKFKPILFSDFSKEYLKLSEPPVKSLKTYQSIKVATNEFLRIAKDNYLHLYSLKTLDDFLRDKISNASEYTARKYRIHLKAMFNLAIAYNHLKENLWNSTIEFNIALDNITYFTKDDFKKFYNAIDNELHQDFFLFSVLTGMRLNELLNFKLSGVDLKNKILTVQTDYEKIVRSNMEVNKFQTKNRKPREIELNPTLIPIIKKYENNSEYLFERLPGVKMSYENLRRNIKVYLKRAGLEPTLSIHDLRHSFAIWMLESTGNMKWVSQQLGHQRMDTTEKHYAKFNTSKNLGYNKINPLK